MLTHFSWIDIIGVAGWPLWFVLGCNSLLITLIYERLWYLWKPWQMRKRWQENKVNQKLTRCEWERLFFQEQRRVHIGFPLIRNLIIICPLVGLLGGLINCIQLLQEEGLTVFYTPTMYSYVVIKLSLPLVIGIGSALIGLIALKLYVKGVKAFITHLSLFFNEKERASC